MGHLPYYDAEDRIMKMTDVFPALMELTCFVEDRYKDPKRYKYLVQEAGHQEHVGNLEPF